MLPLALTSTFSTELFISTLALVAAVILVSALLSGVIERSKIPQVAVFLAIGAVIGPFGLQLMDVALDSPILRVVATLSLTLVLFTDALSLNVAEVSRQRNLALLVLGPGTLASAGLIAVAGWWLLGLSAPMAAILGAALASTDPVMLRGLLRRPQLDSGVKQALRLESGLNDVVLLPVVLIAMSTLVASGGAHGDGSPVRLMLNLLVLSPGAGVFIALFAIGSLEIVRKRFGVRRDYESLYSLGIAFAAFAAAESIHGSGFIAAFAAGLTIVSLDVDLCDCFLEYGETTAEMALLFAFVIFGCSIIWLGVELITVKTIVFSALVFLARVVAFMFSLSRSSLSWNNRLLIAWFGPRGLSSLLLVLLPLFAGIEGSQELVAICCLVVLFSVVLHGASLIFMFPGADDLPLPVAAGGLSTAAAQASVTAPLDIRASAIETPVAGAASAEPEEFLSPDDPVVSVAELKRLMDAGESVIVLDVRREQAYDESSLLAKGAFHSVRNNAGSTLARLGIAKSTPIVTFCSCPEDWTAIQTAKDLIRLGYTNVRALRDGWEAWQSTLPTVARDRAA